MGDRWGLEVCVGWLPRHDGCEAVSGVFCGRLRVDGVWGGEVEWPNACAVGWWFVAIAGSAW